MSFKLGIRAKDAINPVGGAATRTKTVTQVTGRSDSGRITDSQTVLYVEKNGTYQPAAIKKDGKWSYSDPEYPLIVFEVEADGFLYNMVRTIVGTLLQIGNSQRPACYLTDVIRSMDRSTAGSTAPAHGLYLVHVDYPGELMTATDETTAN